MFAPLHEVKGTDQKKGVIILMKSKAEFTVRLDGELYKKLLFVAEHENNSLNNHMLHMIRTNVQYFEKVHGRINTAEVKLPDGEQNKTENK